MPPLFLSLTLALFSLSFGANPRKEEHFPLSFPFSLCPFFLSYGRRLVTSLIFLPFLLPYQSIAKTLGVHHPLFLPLSLSLFFPLEHGRPMMP
jgi:hypothetical protein